MSRVLGKTALDELALQLLAIEEWLRERCEARHADDMADVIEQAYHVVDDLSDEAAS